MEDGYGVEWELKYIPRETKVGRMFTHRQSMVIRVHPRSHLKNWAIRLEVNFLIVSQESTVRFRYSPHKSGELVPIWKNRKHRKESIEKAKETYRKIGHQYGSKNSHYGTVWVTKENENKCIKKEELEKYKKDGWVKGRKLHFENDKITSLDKEVILNLRSEGLTWKEIAKKLSISLTVMQKWKKRNLNNN